VKLTFEPKISDEHSNIILEMIDNKYKNCENYKMIVNNGRIARELING